MRLPAGRAEAAAPTRQAARMVNESNVMSEFIYVLENASMPGLVKIGRTERSVSERVNELSSHTGVPTGFTVVNEYAVANSVEAERIIHERLSDYRVAENREFFKMERASLEAGSIGCSMLVNAFNNNASPRSGANGGGFIEDNSPLQVKNS